MSKKAFPQLCTTAAISLTLKEVLRGAPGGQQTHTSPWHSLYGYRVTLPSVGRQWSFLPSPASPDQPQEPTGVRVDVLRTPASFPAHYTVPPATPPVNGAASPSPLYRLRVQLDSGGGDEQPEHYAACWSFGGSSPSESSGVLQIAPVSHEDEDGKSEAPGGGPTEASSISVSIRNDGGQCVVHLEPIDDALLSAAGEVCLPVMRDYSQVEHDIASEEWTEDTSVQGAEGEGGVTILPAGGLGGAPDRPGKSLLGYVYIDIGEAGEGVEVRATMNGKAVKVLVDEGQQVKQGDGVVVIEAMKMETILRTPAAGTVTSVRVREGDAVTHQQTVVTVKPDTQYKK
ncbi:unnamed protein product [Vitrella brassicaformis CCMP3155]|uniref:Lipoyl-binding domain-containing protein n=1 Tax=Vitrella brassicaformis (strain CCMP3155) TaxID=1169540 RepID=A0A0G4EVU3_VITBC|nr:unnamed protein product [Vitrella brassicaformis CCMP3155]|eukprot:CEM02322.1 unnamed protein product [Vitrella brassicaformis CCMP3155]